VRWLLALPYTGPVAERGIIMAQLIYLADDDPALLEVFGAFLESSGYEVRTFPTGDALSEEFARREPDLVVLDVMMPGTDGLTVCRQLRAVSDVPIVILTAKDSEMDYLHGLAIGGDDYLTKPFSPAMLVMRVKALLRRVDMGRAASRKPDLLTRGDVELSDASHEARAAGRPLQLTMTEFALLRCLLAASGAVSRDELLREVWGIDAEIETRVTDECVRRVRRKLRDAGSATAIKAVWGYGYRLEAGAPDA
jgi:DNA-binding response OmpR family regulator